MQYLLTPYSEKTEFFAWWEGAFTEEQLNFLQKEARNYQSKALVGGGVDGRLDLDYRRSGLSWMPNTPETQWVFQTLAHVASSLNAQFFRFNLVGFGENIQLTNYDESEKGMYGWHIDFNANPCSPCRKLSLVVQLSDPVDYEGGVLEIQPYGKEAIKIRKQRGLIVAFPSWTLHQVTPVTQGNRQSLVSWITGPAFK